MNRVNIAVTDNNGNYYGSFVIRSVFSSEYIYNKIKSAIFRKFESYELFCKDFSWSILQVEHIVSYELECEDKSSVVVFEWSDDYTINVDEIYKEKDK